MLDERPAPPSWPTMAITIAFLAAGSERTDERPVSTSWVYTMAITIAFLRLAIVRFDERPSPPPGLPWPLPAPPCLLIHSCCRGPREQMGSRTHLPTNLLSPYLHCSKMFIQIPCWTHLPTTLVSIFSLMLQWGYESTWLKGRISPPP
jgi:hypothetical protein